MFQLIMKTKNINHFANNLDKQNHFNVIHDDKKE